MNKRIGILWFFAFILFLGMRYCAYSQEVVIDFDGNEYETIQIGNQIWMAENLRSNHDAEGNPVNRYCYENNPDFCTHYGGLYEWKFLNVNEAAESFTGICPEGWHIPSDEEWVVMLEYIGGLETAGSQLKNEDFRDFNIQLAGNFHSRLKNFNFIEEIAYFWTSTEFSSQSAWMRMVGRNNKNATRSTVPKLYCLSVRCVKDDKLENE